MTESSSTDFLQQQLFQILEIQISENIFYSKQQQQKIFTQSSSTYTWWSMYTYDSKENYA